MPREIWWVVSGAFCMIPGTVQTCPQISWMKNCFDVWALVHLYSSPPKCRQMTSQKSNETKYWNLSCCWCQVPGWVLNQQNLWFSHSLSWSIAPRGHGNKSTLNFEIELQRIGKTSVDFFFLPPTIWHWKLKLLVEIQARFSQLFRWGENFRNLHKKSLCFNNQWIQFTNRTFTFCLLIVRHDRAWFISQTKQHWKLVLEVEIRSFRDWMKDTHKKSKIKKKIKMANTGRVIKVLRIGLFDYNSHFCLLDLSSTCLNWLNGDIASIRSIPRSGSVTHSVLWLHRWHLLVIH